jgi:hypothetical protein
MYARLYNLWFVDERARWRLYFGSIAVAFGYGVVNNLLLGRAENRVTWESLGLLCATVTGFSVFYCARKRPSSAEPETYVVRGRNWLVLVSAGAMAIILSVALWPRVDAYRTNYELASIRKRLQMAEDAGTVLPASQIVKYKGTIRATPSSTGEYWKTVAAVINYQSYLNQMRGEAPDPTKVANPCFDENARYNTFEDIQLRNCVIVLDNETFNSVAFRDSVVIYHGGPVIVRNVAFINCRFVLDLAQQPEIPAEKNLLLALLTSPDQISIDISQ